MTLNLTRICAINVNPLENWLRTLGAAGSTPPLPPCDIERLDDEHYALTLSVPGFSEPELSITAQDRCLSVAGRKSTPASAGHVMHREIQTGDFEQTFQLAPHVEVGGAQLMNGLLRIELVRVVPEGLRPRTVEIKSPEPQRWLESNDNREQAA